MPGGAGKQKMPYCDFEADPTVKPNTTAAAETLDQFSEHVSI